MSLDLIVLMPIYNESECLNFLLEEWVETIESLGDINYRFLLINDGSTDHSASILKDWSSKNSRLLILNQQNQGHGPTLINGYKRALSLSPSYIFQVDSDRQFRAKDFLKFWEQRQSSPFLLGKRVNRHDPTIRLWLTTFLRSFLFFFSGQKIFDSNAPFRLFQASFLSPLLERIPQQCPIPNIVLSLEASKQISCNYEIPITHLKRTTGEESLKKGKLFFFCLRSALSLCEWKLPSKRRTKPVHV
jgi:glycosyltransferase involved in cell wall biosynthesis